MVIEWKDAITLLISSAGLALGITNWIKSSILDTRTKLRLTPKISLRTSQGYYSTTCNRRHFERVLVLMKQDEAKELAIAVEVTNLSSFPLFIDEVGVCNTRSSRGPRGVISINAVTMPEGKMPYRLDSRQSVTFYGAEGTLRGIGLPWNAVYAETSHGHLITKKCARLSKAATETNGPEATEGE